MQNVIEFPHTTSRGPQLVAAGVAVTHVQAARSVGNMIEALSRTLDQIRTLCELIPDGPIREQLKAEQSRLLAGLFTARQSAARLSSIGAPTAASDANEQPLALTR
jgi:hypothetical protein